MKTTFIHTADWQLGKPFAGVEDPAKRALLQNERMQAVRRIGELVRNHGASFVVVAGDLFDTARPTQATVASACSAIGELAVPVYVIPGNHDHGGPGSLWEQDFFQREQKQLAPKLNILLKPEPVELENAVLLPCPLLRRHESTDPTTWLRSSQEFESRFADKPRIVIAHGSVLNFGPLSDEDESDAGTPNLIDLTRLPESDLDYLALGDWHGTKQVAAKAWYSGTPELDRFIKGDDHNPGNILVVEAGRSELPRVQSIRTAVIGWHELEFNFADDSALTRLKELVDEKIGNRANAHLLRLQLSGSLGIEAAVRLEQMIDAWIARLLRVKLANQTAIAPSPAELEGLTQRAGDPLVALVAKKLASLASGGDEQAALARVALRELHVACNPK